MLDRLPRRCIIPRPARAGSPAPAPWDRTGAGIAESSVKFVYKTAETVAAADNVVAETETVKEGNIFTRLWQRIVDLFKF